MSNLIQYCISELCIHCLLYVSYTSITAFGIVHVFFIDPGSIIPVTANDTAAGQFLRAFFSDFFS